jgi:amino acid transporter
MTFAIKDFSFSNLFRSNNSEDNSSSDDESVLDDEVLADENALGTYYKGENIVETTNEVTTPEEKVNPLGYSVGPISVIVLILQGVVGTGIFSTPGSVLKSMGSIGATYVLWLTCFLLPLFSTYLYIEFAGYYPKRNGGDVAYLEQAYPKPKFFVPTVYAAISVVLSFTTSSALAFGQYILSAAEVEAKTWYYRGIAIGALTFASLCISLSTKWSLKLQNVLGFVKIIFMTFMVVLGWVVLSGATKVKDPHQSFHNVWEGTTTSGNNIANSIIKVTFSYGGYNYAFGVVAEFMGHKKNVSEKKAKKHLLKVFAVYVPISLFVIFVYYILIITAYYAAASPQQIKSSGNSVATLLFKNAFENTAATKALSAMVSLSAFGHLITAILSHSRALRECGRQGVLPFPKFWTSTKPFGTPLGPIFITWLVNFIMIVAPPAGSAYNFIVDMGSYSGYIFTLFLIFGLLKIRRERRLKGLGKKGQYLPLPLIILLLLFELFVIAIAFVPPKGTLIGSDVSFFYATYAIVTIGLLLVCAAYYFIWRYTLPKLGNYVHREVIYRLENGELGNTVVKVKLDELEEWDKEHDTDENGVSRKLVTQSLEIDDSASSQNEQVEDDLKKEGVIEITNFKN